MKSKPSSSSRCGDEQLVLQREVDAFALAAVAERRVVDLTKVMGSLSVWTNDSLVIGQITVFGNWQPTPLQNERTKKPRGWLGLRVGAFRVRSNRPLRPAFRNANNDAADKVGAQRKHIESEELRLGGSRIRGLQQGLLRLRIADISKLVKLCQT